MNRFEPYLNLRFRAMFFTFVFFSFALQPGQAVVAQETSEQGSDNNQALHEFEQYVGTYGGRIFTLSGGTLYFENDRMPSRVSLKSLGDDSFEVIIPAGAQVRTPGGTGEIPTFLFNRDESGSIESLSLVNPDGTVVVTTERDL
jgi:hypothetical protein